MDIGLFHDLDDTSPECLNVMSMLNVDFQLIMKFGFVNSVARILDNMHHVVDYLDQPWTNFNNLGRAHGI